MERREVGTGGYVLNVRAYSMVPRKKLEKKTGGGGFKNPFRRLRVRKGERRVSERNQVKRGGPRGL